MKNLLKISKKLNELNVYHNIKRTRIVTRRSKTKVPHFKNDIAYLLGVITGDGDIVKSVRKKGGFHYCVRITSGSPIYLNYLNSLFKKHFSISGTIFKDKRSNNNYALRFRNAVIFCYFTLSGHPAGKKVNLDIPNIIDNKSLFLHYLAGLVDTDGYIDSHNRRVQLKQKSLFLLTEIYNRLNKLNMNCNDPRVNYTNSIPFYYIRFDNKLPLRLRSSTAEHRFCIK